MTAAGRGRLSTSCLLSSLTRSQRSTSSFRRQNSRAKHSIPRLAPRLLPPYPAPSQLFPRLLVHWRRKGTTCCNLVSSFTALHTTKKARRSWDLASQTAQGAKSEPTTRAMMIYNTPNTESAGSEQEKERNGERDSPSGSEWYLCEPRGSRTCQHRVCREGACSGATDPRTARKSWSPGTTSQQGTRCCVEQM